MPNPIADPFVENPDTDATSDLVTLEATPEGAVMVTMNRPDKKNAFNAELIGALRETFETLRDQETIRIVFLRGAGGTFSAGADLEWMRDAVEHTEADNRDDAMQMALMLKHLYDIPALTVALVEGGAFGGGAGLAAACDLAIATAGREVRLLRGQARPDRGHHQPLCRRRHRPAEGAAAVRHRRGVRRRLRLPDRADRPGGGGRRGAGGGQGQALAAEIMACAPGRGRRVQEAGDRGGRQGTSTTA